MHSRRSSTPPDRQPTVRTEPSRPMLHLEFGPVEQSGRQRTGSGRSQFESIFALSDRRRRRGRIRSAHQRGKTQTSRAHGCCEPKAPDPRPRQTTNGRDRKSTRLNSSHVEISYAVFCLKKKKKLKDITTGRQQHSSSLTCSVLR